MVTALLTKSRSNGGTRLLARHFGVSRQSLYDWRDGKYLPDCVHAEELEAYYNKVMLKLSHKGEEE